MASVKFSDVSPYRQPKSNHHSSDFRYSQFLDVLQSKNKTSKHESWKAKQVAIFGLGRAGTIHLLNVSANRRMKLRYVVDSDLERLKEIQEKFHLEEETLVLFKDSDKILEDPILDCVIIASPTFSHENITLKALNSNKAVFCEKPLSLDLEGVLRCYELAQKKNLPLLCAMNRQFDPALVAIKDQVHAGKIGQVHVIKSISRDSPLPSIEYISNSKGFFHDCAIHDLDLICWILGEYPTEVFSMAHNFVPEIKKLNDFDTAIISLKFPSGTLGQIDMSRNAIYGYDQRVEVFGAKGMLISGNDRPSQVSLWSNEGETHIPIYHSFASRYHESYKQEIEHFCDALEGKTTITITGESCAKICKITNAIEESILQGKMVKMEY